MATNLIMPALEMAQESGRLLRWLKREGEAVSKGEPIMEIETDKATVEIPAPDSGILGGLLIKEGDVVPVGQTIGWILAPGEKPPASADVIASERAGGASSFRVDASASQTTLRIEASPLARKIAEEHGIDLALIGSDGKRIEKADVLAYIQEQERLAQFVPSAESRSSKARLRPASPMARRLALERGIDLDTLRGSGPQGAVLAADVLGVATPARSAGFAESVGTVWRVMAEHVTHSWTTVPHFYLVREVDASGLLQWRARLIPLLERRLGIKPTFTDLLVKLIAVALRDHPRLNATWVGESIHFNPAINIGIATAIEEGLVVPVIRGADLLSVGEIAARRQDLIERAHNRKLRPEDLSEGTFTISNLGMYGVDAFNAIVNLPQAALLAVGRIADRVVPLNGQVVVRPMMVMTLSCDHRVVDGARAAQFLDDLGSLVEDPLRLLS